eukprot:TRINITY_DN93_c0_g1_i1.p1 TRINITY_DN93_c0_g1~~TRINITY_DN93_c0_g1_i1.p1  ORF type:complete len:215 (+),score=49.49 TRINITY_DN93_c0_g1_i1:70-714(+)
MMFDVPRAKSAIVDFVDEFGLRESQCSAHEQQPSEEGLTDSHSEEVAKPRTLVSDTERPCGHNHWTKQTKKRGKLVLRCDVCQCVWKTRPEAHTKCAAFHAGKCEQGNSCIHPHIYARRETASLARRKARLGVQSEVPEVEKKALVITAAVEEEEFLWERSHTPESFTYSTSFDQEYDNTQYHSTPEAEVFYPTQAFPTVAWLNSSEWRHNPYF